MNMDESSEKGDAAGKTPPITHPHSPTTTLQTDAGLEQCMPSFTENTESRISIFSDN